ncbi:MAG: DNA primase [Treponema sp.]|nr:DNA primase [Treponema sp.]
MALISKTTINEVNTRMDAVSIVGDYLRLEKKSGRWWGRCPFHGGGQEKTPSFKVDPDSKMFYCFGCNKGGNIINFVMEMDKLTYPEAIKSLANKIGIEIIYEEGEIEKEQDTIKEDLYELYRRLTITFQHFLNDKSNDSGAALKYIQDRGISEEMIECFKLGYAPGDRDFLLKFLKQKGYSQDFLGRTGLFSAKYKTMPLFSGRLMFPITDRQGKIVAFGGRALPGNLQSDGAEPPKYINSPETEIYKKGQTLFAIDLAKPAMRQSKSVYVAEGYIDVIAMHQAGIINSVAPLGTAFTDEQASWLRRWVEEVNLIFDNDEAGQKAAYKAIITCRKNGLSCRLINTREGLKSEINSREYEKIKDPADILHEFGSQILKKVLKFTINDFEYLISRGKSQFIETSGDVNGAAEFMFPFLEALDSEVDRSDSITRIADIFRIERAAVQKDYFEWKRKDFRDARVASDTRIANDAGGKLDNVQPKLQIRRNAELSLLTFVAVNMELYPEFRAALEIKEIDDRAAKELFVVLEECYKHDENTIDLLLLRIKDDNLRNFVAEHGTSREFKVNPKRFMEDGIKTIKKKRFEKRLVEINAQMRESERTSENIENIDELLAEKLLIDSRIRKLEGRG